MKELSVAQLPPVASMDRLPLQMSLHGSELLMRYPLGFPSPSNQGYLSDFKLHLPPSLATDPRLWSREDVVYFLRWCEAEFDLPHFDIDLFQMNGKALCFLTKSDLNERCSWSGRVLHNVLQLLIRETNSAQRCMGSSPGVPSTRHPSYPFGALPYGGWSLSDLYAQNAAHLMNSNPVTLSPAPSTDSQSRSPEHSSSTDNQGSSGFESGGSTGSHHSDSEEENFVDASPPAAPPPAPSSPGVHATKLSSASLQRQHSPHAFPTSPNDVTHEHNTNGRLLWDFLQQLLNDPAQRYTNFIAWKNHETGVFKIVDPAGLAKLWGIQKNHLSMNYDKMSRALRYYYRVNILRKVQGERHCYQFLRNPSELKSIKNISLLRQQISLQQQQQQQQQHQQSQAQFQTELPGHPSISIIPVKKEMVKEEEGDGEEDGDGPTDLSTRFASGAKTPASQKPDEEAEKPTDLTVSEPTMHLTIVKSE
ncbi:UNVERIFIED_CONTAM: hypothetical protein PYX00_005963 [Menopon gallinae]|uniref:Ets DNA-binding protein pokkuri n=1 Tax=Menopon gallinae TaxID=328185 RepID=A0AAW2HTV0_9NEOP